VLHLFTSSQHSHDVSIPARTVRPQLTEKRRSRRIEVESLLIAVTSDGVQLHGYSRDLSREGAGAFIRGELEEGQEIGLRFCTHGTRDESCYRAIVRTKVGQRYGLEFLTEDVQFVDLPSISAHQAMMTASGD
jgi:hypothetical protein